MSGGINNSDGNEEAVIELEIFSLALTQLISYHVMFRALMCSLGALTIRLTTAFLIRRQVDHSSDQ